jgi:hypothetical protein
MTPPPNDSKNHLWTSLLKPLTGTITSFSGAGEIVMPFAMVVREFTKFCEELQDVNASGMAKVGWGGGGGSNDW